MTIGYEGATLPQVIGVLKAAGVHTVADVRAVAASRRAGFSKTLLAASLRAEGIDYVHFRRLGTPRAGRDAARRGRVEDMRAIFAAHLTTPEAQAALAALTVLAAERRVALLCFEADAAGCHRRMLAQVLAEAGGQAATDLSPQAFAGLPAT
ncbi:MAG: DUF488 family protein [Rubrimonas sp.]